jgi:glycerophosphoryl diester phosphodiesterase
MEILAHRGWWKTESEKNTLGAFERAMSVGLGLELDIRDHHGEIVIAHDIPRADRNYESFIDFLKIWREYEKPILAVNIKCDGLSGLLSDFFFPEDQDSYFCFDMSVPETIQYLKTDLVIASRLSEYEKDIFGSSNIWLDSFRSDWWIENLPTDLTHRKLYVVSPDLHKRSNASVWNYLKSTRKFAGLCTDNVEEAIEFFRE